MAVWRPFTTESFARNNPPAHCRVMTRLGPSFCGLVTITAHPPFTAHKRSPVQQLQWVSNTTIPRLPVSEVTSTPILGLHNVLYYTTVSPGYLFAVQQTDGARLWSFACDGDVVGTPALSTADGLVFVGTSNGTIFALESLTAEIMWTQALGDSVSTSVVVDNDRLYVGTTTGMVYSFYLDDGGFAWSLVAAGPITATPTLTLSGLLYFVVGPLCFLFLPAPFFA
jgi:outer membrane protein assembly factor BamB